MFNPTYKAVMALWHRPSVFEKNSVLAYCTKNWLDLPPEPRVGHGR